MKTLRCLLTALKRRDPHEIAVAVHGVHHVHGPLEPADDKLVLEYFQTSDFITERLVWTKAAFVV